MDDGPKAFPNLVSLLIWLDLTGENNPYPPTMNAMKTLAQEFKIFEVALNGLFNEGGNNPT